MTMLRQLRRRLQMKSKIALFFMILISFLLQCTLLHVISIGSITPNLILILCISMGLMRGRKSGLWTGFFCGFLVDMFYGSVFGFYALIYMYIGFLSGYAHRICYDKGSGYACRYRGFTVRTFCLCIAVSAQGTSGARNLFIPDYFTGDFLYSDPYTDCLPGISLY